MEATASGAGDSLFPVPHEYRVAVLFEPKVAIVDVIKLNVGVHGRCVVTFDMLRARNNRLHSSSRQPTSPTRGKPSAGGHPSLPAGTSPFGRYCSAKARLTSVQEDTSVPSLIDQRQLRSARDGASVTPVLSEGNSDEPNWERAQQ